MINQKELTTNFILKTKIILKDLNILLFFFTKLIKNLKFKSLHDIGCANGALLNYVNFIFKNKDLYGSDLRKELITDAKKKK